MVNDLGLGRQTPKHCLCFFLFFFFGGRTLSAAPPTVAEKCGSGSGVQDMAMKRKGALWPGDGIGQSLWGGPTNPAPEEQIPREGAGESGPAVEDGMRCCPWHSPQHSGFRSGRLCRCNQGGRRSSRPLAGGHFFGDRAAAAKRGVSKDSQQASAPKPFPSLSSLLARGRS